MSDQTTPPPPDANPYGEQPPAQPVGGQPPQPGESTPVYPAAPPKKPGAGKKVLSILGVIVVALIIIGVKVGLRTVAADEDKTADAKVGDCIGSMPKLAEGEEKEAEAEVVKCDDAKAQFSIAGRVDNLTKAQANADDVCAKFEETEATYVVTVDSKKFYVLCLKPKAAK